MSMASPIELTQMQLYKVAEKVNPDDWLSLGIRLGFVYNEILVWKEEYKGDIKNGIFNMLRTWLGMYPNFTQPDARKFLIDQFKEMERMDLAYLLTKTEVGFVPPHKVAVIGSSRQFEYEVRTYQQEKELSFRVSMHSSEGQVPLSLILDCLTEPNEFAIRLCTCIHILGLRLIRMQLPDDGTGSIKVTVASIDEDGVLELQKRVKSLPNRFADDLNDVICKHIAAGMERSTISLKTWFSEKDEREIGQIIEHFRKEANTRPSDAKPLRVNDLELVRLAKNLDASLVTELGLKLGMSDAEINNLWAMSSRSKFEHILFSWKSKHNPCMNDIPVLAEILESVGASRLASKLRKGELRESEKEEQRRTYLQRVSAHSSMVSAMLSLKLKHPSNQVPPSGAGISQCHKYVNYPPEDTKENKFVQHTYVNTTGLQDEGRPPQGQGTADSSTKEPDYESIIFRTEDAKPTEKQANIAAEANPDYEVIKDANGGEMQTAQNENDHTYVQLREPGIQKGGERRISHKRLGTSAIPVIDRMDFSILEDMWDRLDVFGVTRDDTMHIAGLVKLAHALDRMNQRDIADAVWISLIRENMKNEYLHKFVTGSIKVVPRVITNRQDFEMGQLTTLEEVVNRTKALEYPSRIFIEANEPLDRQMVAEKLGYDWAIEKDPHSPLGNVDLLYVLNVADIAPGSSVGGAVASQRVCKEFELTQGRIEDYFKSTMTEYVIVLRGDENDFQKLLSVAPLDESKYGFSDLIKGKYLSHCIVIMTIGPQALAEGPKNFAHYKLLQTPNSAASDC
ncbi:uncharacterized protein LOC121416911 [Lytechinus variegatus]|uniref:uncharacterized protein LOC121416911 n=1 Tax=Lytechinus variegatus TaxID=7654 RepID=UPI001BB0EA4F|nr:uncharacterized protein LOC121416911 [Lytechinus variegatus]